MTKYIPDEILKPFLRSYGNGDVWQVHCGDRWLTVWLYLDSQIDRNRNLPVYQKMKEEYYKLVDQYLDLNISSPADIDLSFDSKENFDTKYRKLAVLLYIVSNRFSSPMRLHNTPTNLQLLAWDSSL